MKTITTFRNLFFASSEADWSRIKSSVIRYIEFHKKINMKAPINYEPLINKIKES